MKSHPVTTMAEETRQLILEGITELGKPVDIPIIARAFSVSELSAKHHLDALVQAGKLRKIFKFGGGTAYRLETQEKLF